MEILLVEDNSNDAELAMRAIRRTQFRGTLIHVEDGVQALDHLFGDHGAAAPHVVLLDLKLPRIDGADILARIKADPRGRRIPVVILSSSRDIGDIERCYASGANSFIVKPIGFDDYQRMIDDLITYWTRRNQPAVPISTSTA